MFKVPIVWVCIAWRWLGSYRKHFVIQMLSGCVDAEEAKRIQVLIHDYASCSESIDQHSF